MVLVPFYSFQESVAVPNRKPARVIGEHRSSNRGFTRAEYTKYLASPEWRAIRGAVLSKRPNCELCGDVATQVHHDSYHTLVMVGLMNDSLVAICRDCHVGIEFEGDRKLDSVLVRRKLRKWLIKTGRSAVANRLKNAQKVLSGEGKAKPASGPNRELEKRRRDAEAARKARQGDPKAARPVSYWRATTDAKKMLKKKRGVLKKWKQQQAES
jgi:hypothetical protein